MEGPWGGGKGCDSGWWGVAAGYQHVSPFPSAQLCTFGKAIFLANQQFGTCSAKSTATASFSVAYCKLCFANIPNLVPEEIHESIATLSAKSGLTHWSIYWKHFNCSFSCLHLKFVDRYQHQRCKRKGFAPGPLFCWGS